MHNLKERCHSKALILKTAGWNDRDFPERIKCTRTKEFINCDSRSLSYLVH